MATNSNFLMVPSIIEGLTQSSLIAVTTSQYQSLGTYADSFVCNLGKAGYSKNGGIILSLAVSTPITIDLTSLATGSYSSAGDTTFATVHELIFNNFGANDVTVHPASSSAFNGPLAGTDPIFIVAANSTLRWQSFAGWTVTGSIKKLTFDPGSNACSISLCVGGA